MIHRRSFLRMLGAVLVLGPTCAVRAPQALAAIDTEIAFTHGPHDVWTNGPLDAVEEADVWRYATMGTDTDAQLSRIVESARLIVPRRFLSIEDIDPIFGVS